MLHFYAIEISDALVGLPTTPKCASYMTHPLIYGNVKQNAKNRIFHVYMIKLCCKVVLIKCFLEGNRKNIFLLMTHLQRFHSTAVIYAISSKIAVSPKRLLRFAYDCKGLHGLIRGEFCLRKGAIKAPGERVPPRWLCLLFILTKVSSSSSRFRVFCDNKRISIRARVAISIWSSVCVFYCLDRAIRRPSDCSN